MQNYDNICQFRITHTIAIKWKEKYDVVVVDPQHSLGFYGDRMKMSLITPPPPPNFFFMETPTSPWVPFRVKLVQRFSLVAP